MNERLLCALQWRSCYVARRLYVRSEVSRQKYILCSTIFRLHPLRTLRLGASRLARPDRRADQRGDGEERAADPSQPSRLRRDDPAAEDRADDAGKAFNRGHGAEDSAPAVGWG